MCLFKWSKVMFSSHCIEIRGNEATNDLFIFHALRNKRRECHSIGTNAVINILNKPMYSWIVSFYFLVDLNILKFSKLFKFFQCKINLHVHVPTCIKVLMKHSLIEQGANQGWKIGNFVKPMCCKKQCLCQFGPVIFVHNCMWGERATVQRSRRRKQPKC